MLHLSWLSIEGTQHLSRVSERLLSQDMALQNKPRVQRSHLSENHPSTAAQPIKGLHSNGLCSYSGNQIEMHSLRRDLSFLDVKTHGGGIIYRDIQNWIYGSETLPVDVLFGWRTLTALFKSQAFAKNVSNSNKEQQGVCSKPGLTSCHLESCLMMMTNPSKWHLQKRCKHTGIMNTALTCILESSSCQNIKFTQCLWVQIAYQ